jgi:dihydrofolate reductase
MRPVIMKMEMSLDGYVGAEGVPPSWPVRYYDDELAAYVSELLTSAGVHAMGRHSYEEMGPYWQASDEPFAWVMNDIPKAVFSRTLEHGDWPETRVFSDLESGMAELRDEDGGPVLVHGGSDLVQQLTRLSLIDELHINMQPETFGSGLPLFGAPATYQLQDVRRFPSGTVALTYTR